MRVKKYNIREKSKEISELLNKITILYSNRTNISKFYKRISYGIIANAIGYGGNIIIRECDPSITTTTLSHALKELQEGRFLPHAEYVDLKAKNKDEKSSNQSDNYSELKDRALEIIEDFKETHNGTWPTLGQLAKELIIRYNIKITNKAYLGKMLHNCGAVEGKYPITGQIRFNSIFESHPNIRKNFESALKKLQKTNKLTLENLSNYLRKNYEIKTNSNSVINLAENLGWSRFDYYGRMTDFEIKDKKKNLDDYRVFLAVKYELRKKGITETIQNLIDSHNESGHPFTSLIDISKEVEKIVGYRVDSSIISNILYHIGYSKITTFIYNKEKAEAIEKAYQEQREAWIAKRKNHNPDKSLTYIIATTNQINRIYAKNKEAKIIAYAVLCEIVRIVFGETEKRAMSYLETNVNISKKMIKEGYNILNRNVPTEEFKFLEEKLKIKEEKERKRKEKQEIKKQIEEAKKKEGRKNNSGRYSINIKYPQIASWMKKIFDNNHGVPMSPKEMIINLHKEHNIIVSEPTIIKLMDNYGIKRNIRAKNRIPNS